MTRVRGGVLKMSSVQVVIGKKGISLMIRDTEPFSVERWSDVETGNENIDEYRLVFDFSEDLLVEITQRPEGAVELSWEVPLDQLDEESLMRLKNSKSLERIRAKVREIVQQLTQNLDSVFFDLLDTLDSRLLQIVREQNSHRHHHVDQGATLHVKGVAEFRSRSLST